MSLKEKDDTEFKAGTYVCIHCDFKTISLDEYTDHMRHHNEL